MNDKPNFSAFAATAKRQAKPLPEPTAPSGAVKHLQVRLAREDAVRLRRAAEDRGQTLQAALVDAINLYLRDAGEPPATDPGTGAPIR
jgi:hypothetical protein